MFNICVQTACLLALGAMVHCFVLETDVHKSRDQVTATTVPVRMSPFPLRPVTGLADMAPIRDVHSNGNTAIFPNLKQFSDTSDIFFPRSQIPPPARPDDGQQSETSVQGLPETSNPEFFKPVLLPTVHLTAQPPLSGTPLPPPFTPPTLPPRHEEKSLPSSDANVAGQDLLETPLSELPDPNAPPTLDLPSIKHTPKKTFHADGMVVPFLRPPPVVTTRSSVSSISEDFISQGPPLSSSTSDPLILTNIGTPQPDLTTASTEQGSESRRPVTGFIRPPSQNPNVSGQPVLPENETSPDLQAGSTLAFIRPKNIREETIMPPAHGPSETFEGPILPPIVGPFLPPFPPSGEGPVHGRTTTTNATITTTKTSQETSTVDPFQNASKTVDILKMTESSTRPTSPYANNTVGLQNGTDSYSTTKAVKAAGETKDSSNIRAVTYAWSGDRVEYGNNDFVLTGYGVFVPLFLVILLLLTILMAVVLVMQMKGGSKMNKASLTLLMAVAVLDGLTVAAGIPEIIYIYSVRTEHGVLPHYSCKYKKSLELLSAITHTASVWLTVFLATHRWFCVSRPFQARRVMSLKASIIAISSAVIGSLALYVIRFVDASFEPVMVPSSLNSSIAVETCRLVNQGWIADANLYETIYIWCHVFLGELIPCGLLLTFGILLARQLRQAAIRMKNLNAKNFRQYRERRRLSLYVLIVAVIACAAELPVGILLCLYSIQFSTDLHILGYNHASKWGYGLNMWLYISYFAIFAIYCIMAKEFRSFLQRCCQQCSWSKVKMSVIKKEDSLATSTTTVSSRKSNSTQPSTPCRSDSGRAEI